MIDTVIYDAIYFLLMMSFVQSFSMVLLGCLCIWHLKYLH